MSTERKSSTLSERAGVLLGRSIAPVFALTTRARRARTFHPRGDLVFGEVESERDVATQDLPLALALSGNVLARFSSALFRGVRWPDVLGCALRFERAGAGVQDLLFATIKRPWTMPFAPFTTRVADYFANDYFAVSPFSTPFPTTGSRVYFRLHTADSTQEDGHGKPKHRSFLRQRSFSVHDMSNVRRGSLARAIADGTAALQLSVADGPRGPWRPCVRVRLTALVLAAEPERLAFDPFRSARGIEPIGFVHALRRGVYEASQAARGAATTHFPAGMTLPPKPFAARAMHPQFEGGTHMIRSLLVYLGLRKAPAPVRNYVAASSVFGALPVAAFFVWKYRDQIKQGVQRFNRMPITES